MKIIYKETPLAEVIRHYSDGFTPKDGVKVEKAEHFVDAQQGVVIFKLYVAPELAVVK